MIKKSDDRRVRRTKRALRQGLAQLLTQKKLKDISVRELTDLVDLHRGTFYVHYRDIYDLYAKVQEEMIQEITQIMENYPLDTNGEYTLFPIARELIHYVKENQVLCSAMMGEHGDMDFINDLSKIVGQRCIERWKMMYRGCPPQKYEYFSVYVLSGCIGILREWINGGMLETADELAQIIEQMAVQGTSFLK